MLEKSLNNIAVSFYFFSFEIYIIGNDIFVNSVNT